VRNKKALTLLCLGGLILFSILPARRAWAAKPVVCAVIFYSPNCGHCYKVLTEDLPPLIEQYGNQLQIIAINVTAEEGQALFQAALEKFGLLQGGVPMLVVGDHFLVGSIDIPAQFPGLVEQYLAKGGVDWPDIPGLAEAIGAAQVTPTPSAVPPTLTAAHRSSLPPASRLHRCLQLQVRQVPRIAAPAWS
jgi:thiol-disulfide isomerase/thioredoxin